MVDFEGLYFSLFATMADAVELLEQEKTEEAKQRLISALQEAEERYLQEAET